MSWVTLLGVRLGRAAGRASCFTSWAIARSTPVVASAHAPAIANAVRIGLMVFLPMDGGEPLFQSERADLPAVVAKRDPASGGCQGGWGPGIGRGGERRGARSESPGYRGSRGRATGGPFREPCNLGAVVSKIVLEPERKRIRL